ARRGRVPFQALARALGARGLTTLLIEGGGTVAAEALRARTVDRLILFLAPELLGGEGVPAIGPLGLSRIADAVGVEHLAVGRINFLVTHARGLVCLVLPPERMRQLGIPLIPPAPGRAMPAYCASIEARRGVSTGISASDRATTVLAAVAPDAKPADLVMPGHVTPIQATPGGTLVHAGLPEAASDLARLAGLGSAAVICAVLGPSGDLATAAELAALAGAHGLPRVGITEVIHMRLRSDTLVQRVAEA